MIIEKQVHLLVLMCCRVLSWLFEASYHGLSNPHGSKVSGFTAKTPMKSMPNQIDAEHV